ncbi:MAG: uncharacterized protein H6R26_48 [Proteobacteria bacterium]|nr:uncharacterized protein [Pseudomonadota bacterium]
MRRMFATLRWTGLFALLSVFSTGAFSAEYVFRDLMANTLPPAKCADKADASANAEDAANIKKYAKVFCETQGYGWHVSEEKNAGKLACNECAADSGQGKYQCHLEDVVVTCKRLKPGSVGMFPGKG